MFGPISTHRLPSALIVCPPSSTSGLIAWSAFEADKFCLYDFVSSSAIWPSDYESDYGPTCLNTSPTSILYKYNQSLGYAKYGRETGAYNCKHSFLDTLEEIFDDDHGIISTASSLDSYDRRSSYLPHHPFGPSFSTPFLSIKPIYVSMAPSTRNAARCGATGTGTHDPTVSDTYVMRTRSGVDINPPAKQNNKCQRNAVPESSPAPDDPNRPKPRPLPRRSSGTTFEDYARVLARPRKQNVKPTVDSVSSGMELQSDHPPDTPDIDDDVPVTDTRMDDDMNSGSDNDADDDMTNEDREHSQANEDEDEDNDGSYMVGKADGCHHEDNVEGDSDNDAKDGDEEPEGGENNEDFETSQVGRADGHLLVKTGSYNLHFDDGSQSSSSDTSYREGPATSDQDSAHESDANKDLDLDHNSLSSPPAKRRKRSSAIETTLANTSQKTSHSTTVHKKHASISHGSNSTPASIVFGPTPDIDNSENEDEPSGHLKCGWLCQEGIDEAQELGQKTAEEARVIGAKYGKSVRAILIEAGLSIKHSQSESDWNAHQCWFMDKHPRKDKEYDANSRVSAIIDWKEHQHKHYHAMGKDDEEWDIIFNYNVTGSNTNQSRAKTISSMREDIARKLSAYSRLEGVEAISCIFDTTQDEAARQASSFVAGSDLIVKLINEHQLDARAILDWVVTAMKAKGYNISVPQFMGGVGAYKILLSKPNEAPHDHYRRIWPIMVLEHTLKFGYRPKAVQWQKLLDYAFQYKFMIKNWPEDILPIGPEFNPHNLSSQHLKLLVVPFIKRKAHSYYEAELRTEAESLLELEKKKSKGKHRNQGCTVEDVMSELDVDVPEIEFAAWPDGMSFPQCIKQLNDEVPEMFDIPLVTSALDVVLHKLVDSAKFKVSVPEDILAAHEAHPDGQTPSTHDMLPSDHESPVTPSPPTLLLQ
ncbi:uncharacterized protein HD556DRAFT_1309322 [Suillus plorans]|uniref:Uncharacterized protein n=1 Tax=Suillus plorans TaxID=116603 RepID=A0A9P7DH52_9AGAM|nr:uncharacterized protein HD556DRAFT_1309322 [Suillus plorans]KAG1792508.1 hypothetical protein HD556DRAFT_1309322 [Suillus plorans]